MKPLLDLYREEKYITENEIEKRLKAFDEDLLEYKIFYGDITIREVKQLIAKYFGSLDGGKKDE